MTMKVVLLVLLLARSACGDTVRDAILGDKDISVYATGLTSMGMLDNLLDATDKNFTVFAPTNEAVLNDKVLSNLFLGNMNDEAKQQWRSHVIGALRNSIAPGVSANMETLYQWGGVATMDNMNLTINAAAQSICGADILRSVETGNGWLHVMSGVMAPLFFDNSLEVLELQEEFGPDYLERTSLVDVVDFVDGREIFDRFLDTGMTQVGCRIRAYNRITDYIKQTINWSKATSVIDAELLNASRVKDTITEYLEYSLLPGNFYLENFYLGYEELVMPINKCAHMWVTSSKARGICFNDACMVHTPDARYFLASNGVGYVTDKCVVCPGVAMLAVYTADYTSINMKDLSQFFESSEWNLRNMSMNFAGGAPVTLFASHNEGFFQINSQDTTRLLTIKWQPHNWDFLSHMMIPGNFTYEYLDKLYETKGGDFNLTSLANQSLPVTRAEDGTLEVAGGKIFKTDIQGIDGMMHFVDKVPRVRSVTHSVYELGIFLGFEQQINLIDTVFLDEDMNRLTPLTALFAPNEVWANKIVSLGTIETILENHLFENLFWCKDLMTMEGQMIDSLSGEEWTIRINDEGQPCFATIEEFGQPTLLSCITKCDILARNGVVHEVTTVMLKEGMATRGPSPPTPPTYRMPTKPSGGNNRYKPEGDRGPDTPTAPVSFSRPEFLFDDDVITDDQAQDLMKKAAAIPTRTVAAVAIAAIAAVLPYFVL
jgi:uncharacterized surface protein with fasciclin (FAS1) repeats